MEEELEGMVVFCNRGHVMFSNIGEIINKPKKKSNTVYINPVFNIMIAYCEEDEIKKFFIKASKNIFPKDLSFNNNILTHKSKKKQLLLNENNNIREEYLKFKIFYEQNIKYKRNTSLHIKEEYEEINSWKDATKLQDYLIIIYIKKLKKKYCLSIKECCELESLLKIALTCNYINNTNIIVKKNIIVNIENINFDEKNRKFAIINKNLKSIKIAKNLDSNNSYNDSLMSDNNEFISIEKKIDKILSFITKNYTN